MPVSYPYTRYSGMWTAQAQCQAVGNSTWTGLPELWSWGQNAYGQLGLNNRTNYSSPKQVGSLTDWFSISPQQTFTLAIKTNGTLWSWGRNNNGQLGLGNLTYYSSPKQVGALTTWSKIYAGRDASFAIKRDGTLWVWGWGWQGQLGLGSTTSYSSPKQLGSLSTWASISGNRISGVYAVKTDGTLWSWGQGTYGALGLGNTITYYSPKQVGTLATWLAVAGGSYQQAVAIKTDGTLWSWGYNANGELGLGDTVNRSSPTQVGALTTWVYVASGSNHSLAIKTDGTLWSWGYNNHGQLGLNNRTSYSSPKQIGALTTWLNISAGAYTNGVIKTDGTLWSWGQNNYGQLGLGNTTSYSSPKQVGALTSWTSVALSGVNTIALKR